MAGLPKKMKIILVFFFLSIAIDAVYSVKICKDIVKFDGQYYEKEYLADGTVSKPFFMSYLKDKNKILFNSDTEPFGDTATYLLDLKTKELKEITTVKRAVANVVDENGVVYIGQDGGLFILNVDTQELTPTNLKDVDFYSVLYRKNKFYYVDFPKKDLYVYENGENKLLIGGLQINDIAFDSKDNMYYYNKTGFFYIDANSKETIELNAVMYEEVPLVALIYDERNNAVYALSVYGVFKVDTKTNKVTRISMKPMYDVYFDDEGKMIYSDEQSIVRLLPTTKTC